MGGCSKGFGRVGGSRRGWEGRRSVSFGVYIVRLFWACNHASKSGSNPARRLFYLFGLTSHLPTNSHPSPTLSTLRNPHPSGIPSTLPKSHPSGLRPHLSVPPTSRSPPNPKETFLSGLTIKPHSPTPNKRFSLSYVQIPPTPKKCFHLASGHFLAITASLWPDGQRSFLFGLTAIYLA